MTAQQQLAELIECPNPDEAPSWNKCAGNFLRDHGPAIAELIEAVGKWRRAETKFKAAAAIEQIKTAHDKLTQDA